ncbi:MAG: UDP-3-O-(3-hydroxymyristoyl)glucosamine N-acyltransferase [Candidatus Sericytochromatia bacterium]|nr:UDP-3-O-(3-hydroxymyristoyl)glucosamine N-acyltransferase [Candidatus Sericytochromatia bacterium]
MTATWTLGELAARVRGELQGDPETRISTVSDPREAGPDSLVFLLEPGFRALVEQSQAAAVVTARPLERFARAQLVVPDARIALATLLPLFAPPRMAATIHETAVVDDTAFVAPGASLGPYAVVGAGSRVGAGTILHAHVVLGRDTEVGDGCELFPHVVLYDGVRLGARTVIHAGTVLGSDGYGFVADQSGRHLKIPQLGTLEVAGEVEIGANVTIDRGTLGATRLGRGTKIDNLVHIGHNVQVGEDVLIVSQTGISGGVRIGDRATLAGQVGVAGHLTIGDQAVILARAGVTKNVPARAWVSGFPARAHAQERRRQGELGLLTALRATVRDLAARLRILETGSDALLAKPDNEAENLGQAVQSS